MVLGFALFIGLSAFAAVAALAIAVRMRGSGRAETALSAFILWNAIVLAPLTWLGWTDHLTRFSAGTLVGSTALGALTLSFVKTEPMEHLRQIRRALWGLVRMPIDAAVRGWQHDAFVAFGVVFAMLTMLWTTWLSYLAPNTSWDGIWYHDTIVGWSIQNHGFSTVLMPFTLENVNGVPRLCETMSLWFVLFTDRRLIEAPNSVIAAPMLMLGFYCIARRHTRTLTGATGWAAALYLMPASLLQMRSTYVDVYVAAFFLAGLHYSTRPEMRLRDGWMAGLCLGMLGASKALGLPWMCIIGAVALPRLLWSNVWRAPFRTIGTMLGSLVIAGSFAAPSYVRNWRTNHNPFWPVMISLPKLNINWPGNFDPVIERPLQLMLADMLAVPVPGRDFHDPRVWGYGLGFPFFVLPWALLMAPVVIVCIARSLFTKSFDRVAWNLLLVVLPIAATWPLAPQKWFARYNLQIVAGLAFVASWSSTRTWVRRASEGLAAICIGTSLMMLYWADPGWSVDIPTAFTLAKMSPRERASFEAAGYVYESKTAAAREEELGPGDVVAFTDTNAFPSLLWNEQFSNVVTYIQSGGGESFLSRCDTINAKWVVATAGTPEFQALKSHPTQWAEVGYMCKQQDWMAFRRVM
jgi:hypothetical protein